MINDIVNEARVRVKKIRNSVIKSQPLDKGFESKNYLIASPEGKFVFKIYKQRSVEEVSYEMSILDKLKETSVSKFPRRASDIFIFNGSPAVILDFIPGRSLNLNDINGKTINITANLIGKMHLALLNFKPKGEKERLNIFDLSFMDYAAPETLKNAQNSMRNRTLKLREELNGYKNTKFLNKSIIHDDPSPDNIILSESGDVSLIDFDEAHVGEAVSDVAVAIKELILCTVGVDKKLIKVFLESYGDVIALSDMELDILPLLICRRNLFMLAYWMSKIEKDPAVGKKLQAEIKLSDLLAKKGVLINGFK